MKLLEILITQHPITFMLVFCICAIVFFGGIAEIIERWRQ